MVKKRRIPPFCTFISAPPAVQPHFFILSENSHSIQNYYAKTLDATRQQYMRELENKDKQYRDILTDKNRWLRRMFFCLIGMLAVISFLLIVDFINPTIGVFHP
mgnify:CR=1 FL=1